MSHPALKKTGNGEWEISQTVMEDIGAEAFSDYSVTRYQVHMGGQPSKLAHNLAVAALYEPDLDLIMQTAAARKQSCTVLVVGSSGSVDAREGKFIQGGQGLAFMKKGSASKGYYVNDKFRPLDVHLAYNGQEIIAERWWEHDALVPQVRNADLEGIPEYQEDGPREELIHAAFLLHYPDFNGGRIAGCLFLATDVQTDSERPDYGIANGYLWAPADSPITPEHGSQYLKDMHLIGGRVTNFTPGQLTFADCVNEKIPGTRREAYAFVLGTSVPA